jgi:ribulose 1,5-bisphosphate carboxylase large subunit-like protein
VTDALKRASDKTGMKVLYAPHITTTPDRILDSAFEALENGATALMLNFLAAGFSSIEILRKNADICAPIYAHCGGREALGRAGGQGIAPSVIVKMVRLLGGDYFRAGMYDSYLVDTDEDIAAMHDAATGDWCSLNPILPAVSGGLNPGTVGANVRALGRNALLLAGSGVFSHPDGPKAGVTALRDAARAALAG